MFGQKIVNYASFLFLNLIGRAQEKIQMSHAINMLIRDGLVHRILSIQVDALYVAPPKGKLQEVQKTFSNVTYSTLPSSTETKAYFVKANVLQPSKNTSNALVYKVSKKPVRYPGGTLKLTQSEPPSIKDADWHIIEEHDNFLETILDRVKSEKSFSVFGPPGVGKSFVLRK